MSKLETQLKPLAMGILRGGKVGTSKLQLKASFEYIVSYGMDRKWSRKTGKQKWKIKGGRSRHRELEISAPIEEVTLGGLQHD